MTPRELETARHGARLAFFRGEAECAHPFTVSAPSCLFTPDQEGRCYECEDCGKLLEARPACPVGHVAPTHPLDGQPALVPPSSIDVGAAPAPWVAR